MQSDAQAKMPLNLTKSAEDKENPIKKKDIISTS